MPYTQGNLTENNRHVNFIGSGISNHSNYSSGGVARTMLSSTAEHSCLQLNRHRVYLCLMDFLDNLPGHDKVRPIYLFSLCLRCTLYFSPTRQGAVLEESGTGTTNIN